MASDFTAKETIDEKVYQFELLSLSDALEVESKVAAIIAAVMGKGEKDHALLYQVGKTICKGLCIDDFEVTNVDEEFRGKALLFNKVLIAGVKANFPDFFSLLTGSEDSPLGEALAKSGLASAL